MQVISADGCRPPHLDGGSASRSVAPEARQNAPWVTRRQERRQGRGNPDKCAIHLSSSVTAQPARAALHADSASAGFTPPVPLPNRDTPARQPDHGDAPFHFFGVATAIPYQFLDAGSRDGPDELSTRGAGRLSSDDGLKVHMGTADWEQIAERGTPITERACLAQSGPATNE